MLLLYLGDLSASSSSPLFRGGTNNETQTEYYQSFIYSPTDALVEFS